MNNSNFVHLHTHNEFSQLDGMGTGEDYAKRAKQLGFKYLALTNHANIDGLIKFQKACKDNDIIPILGCELYVVEDVEKSTQEQSKIRGHLQVHVKSQTGFENLTKLLTIANTDGFYYKPRVDYAMLLQHTEGLVFSTACLISFARVLPNGMKFLADLYDIVGGDLYAEIMPHRIKKQPIWNRKVIRIAKRFGLKCYASNDCHYPKRTEAIAQETLLAIQRKTTWNDPKRFKFSLRTFHMKTAKEMIVGLEEFGQYKPEYLTNTLEVAEKCGGYVIPKRDIDLPKVRGVPSDKAKEKQFLLNLCSDGYKKRFGEPIIENKVYLDRMMEEYELITSKNFQRYFLMVWELINWCNENGILVGPGRGSVGGSLIAYLLGITTVDPIVYNLLFSRFINEDRIDYPDIDIDFEDSKRHLIRQHLEDIYGSGNVAGVASFNRMKARAVVKDVGRVFNIHWRETDTFTKLVEDNDEHTGIQDAIDNYEECARFAAKYPRVIKLAKMLEGTVRGYCVTGDTRVLLKNSQGGAKQKTIAKMYEEGFKDEIRAYNFDEKRFYFDKVTNIYDEGIRLIFALKVRCYKGKIKTVKITRNHRVLTQNGWKELQHLNIETDRVATNGVTVGRPFEKGCTPWNKGLTKEDHYSIQNASDRWVQNNPSKKLKNKRRISKRSRTHGRAANYYKTLLQRFPICQRCDAHKSEHRHHKDRNRDNNKRSNLEALCHHCHWDEEHAHNINAINKDLQIHYGKILSIKLAGRERVYDIEMTSKNQNFVGNKMVLHNSQHAAALVVSQDTIGYSGRCNLISNRDGATLVNWEKEDTEYVGLMKLDALGLKLLSILAETVRLIRSNQNTEVDLAKINMHDKDVLAEINAGNNVGLFQLGTWSMTTLIKEMGVSNFKHISDAVALVRPGPANSGMTTEYIQRKHGASWEPMHEIYERITEDTYGLLVYQEQVMQVVSEIADLPYSTADKVRKIIGKKRNVKEFEKYKRMFVNGCKKTGYFNKQEALEFWDGLEKWSKYGFNRCVVGSTVLERANYNQHAPKDLTVEELHTIWNSNTSTANKYQNTKRGLQIMQEQDGFIKPGRVKDVFYQGRRMVFKVKTQGGRSITGTRNHRLLTYNGYKRIDELITNQDWLAIKGPKRAKHKNKGHKGWSKGLHWSNGKPPEKDGRTRLLSKTKELVEARANGFCESCNKSLSEDKRPEFAHLQPEHDIEKYHHPDNVKLLCNPCHKAIDTHCRGWFKKGFRVEYDKIISIQYMGIEDVFDIEMEKPHHNFIANGIVSHNSHSVEYAMLGYWCASLKKYFPTEFICGSLTYGAQEKKAELIEEAYRLGLTLVLPKVGRSHATAWKVNGKQLFIPFIEVNGIGPVKAEQAASAKPVNNIRRFYTKHDNKKTMEKFTGSFGELLDKLGAYDTGESFNVTEEVKELFKFRITANPTVEYSNLYQLFNNQIRLNYLDPLLEGDNKVIAKFAKDRDIIHKVGFIYQNNNLLRCQKCNLINECTAPVHPSPGLYNLAIVGEAPGGEEDKQREGFVGRSGDKVWQYLSKQGYERPLFHVTNVAKCYPRDSKKPNADQINICGKTYLHKELTKIKPKVILSFGNTGLQFFTGQKTGIMNMSGKVQWNEEYSAWVCFCMHPAASLHNPDNAVYYESGMKSFCNLLKSLQFRGD